MKSPTFGWLWMKSLVQTSSSQLLSGATGLVLSSRNNYPPAMTTFFASQKEKVTGNAICFQERRSKKVTTQIQIRTKEVPGVREDLMPAITTARADIPSLVPEAV